MRRNCKVLAALTAMLLGLFAAAGAAVAGQTYYTELENLVKNVSIIGAEVSGTTWTVQPDTPYEMTVVFQETGHKQFDMDAPSFTYQLPMQIVIEEAQTGTNYIAYKYNRPGEPETTYRIPYNYTIATDGIVEVTFDYDAFLDSLGDMPEQDKRRILDALKRSTDLSIVLDIKGEFHAEDVTLEWGNNVTTDVVVNLEEKHDLFIEKTADYERGDGFVYYTLKVTSEGNNQNIVVKDTLSGNALIFDSAAGVSISGAGSSVCTPITDPGATFAYNIDAMTDGQVIEFTYRAEIDYDADDDHNGQLTFDQTRNTATVSGDGTDEKKTNQGHYIQFSSVLKGYGQVIEGDTQGQTQTVSWIVEVNRERVISIGGTSITDRIMTGSAPMHYSGSGITVLVYDVNGALVDTRNVPWGTLGVDPSTATSYTYDFPEGDGVYYYVITYTTDVDVSQFTGEGSVSNTVETEYGSSGGSAGITREDETRPKLSKAGIEYSIDEVTWQVVVHVPEGGLPAEYSKLTDTMPSRINPNVSGGIWWDELILDSISVTGLQEGDSYTVTYGDHGFEIQFKTPDDNNVLTDGLKDVDAAYDVYVTFKTKNNKDWIKFAADNPYARVHQNTATLGLDITATAIETIVSPYVDKSLTSGTILELDDGKRYLEYNIVLGGITSGDTSATIRDIFDTSIFRVPTDAEVAARPYDLRQQFTVFGGNQNNQLTAAGTAIYSNTGDGIEIIITDIPDDPATHDNYAFLRIHYWLALKDDVDLDQLAANSEHGVWKTINRAIWNDVEDDATFEYGNIILDKKLLNEAEITDDSRTAHYRITYNPGRGRVNNGEDIILQDTWKESLNIDYASIRITTDPESAGDFVQYTISGYTATYTIPDQTAVTIEYDATVIGKGAITIGNTASDGYWTAKTEKEYFFQGGGTGTASSIAFIVVKADENNNRERLQGVRFKLTAPEGYPLQGDEEEVILETDENGYIYIDQQTFNLYYYDFGDNFNEDDPSTYITYTLTEMEPPPGYEELGFSYTLSFTNDTEKISFGNNKYIYYRSGSMQIKNKPLEGLIVKKKTVSDQSGDKDKKFRFTVTLDDDTINGTYGNVNAEGQYDEHAVTFTNGVATFLLKDGEYKQAVGLPSGIGFTIVETEEDGTPVEGFSTVSSGRTSGGGSMAAGDATFAGTTQIEASEITYVNTKVSPTSITFRATKVLTGRKMTGGEFTFGVYENGELIQTVQNDENGVVSFEAIPYKLADAGIHTYIIKEIVPEGVTPENPTQGGYTYDLTSYTVKVQVVYYGDGILGAGVIDVYEN